MKQYQNDLILRAALGEQVERTPVWVMRQAGRILPEYRAIRAKLSGFKELVETPDLACEVTLQPIRRFDMDAAIIFSDILVVPEAMGCTYEMEEGRGPIFPEPIKNIFDVNNLYVPDPEKELKYVLDAIRLTVKNLDKRIPLIGFAGAPWTIFAYMIEGKGSKTFAHARKALITEPQFAHQLMQKITDTTILYLQAQIAAGAAMIQVFDSWAGILSPSLYHQFAIPYLEQICNAIKEVPITIFAKGAFFALEALSKLPCNTIGLDWHMPIEQSRLIVGTEKTLQGNFDPCLLYASPEKIVSETEQMLSQFGKNKHIANLGHGVYPDTPFENVKIFVDTIKKYKHP